MPGNHRGRYCLVCRFFQPPGAAIGVPQQVERGQTEGNGQLDLAHPGPQSVPFVTGQVVEADAPLLQCQGGEPPGISTGLNPSVSGCTNRPSAGSYHLAL